MHGNMYHLKKKMRPDLYENGPVKILSASEIAEWEASPQAVETRQKMDLYASMDKSLIEFLDSLTVRDAEADFKDVLKGERERPANE